MTCYHPLLAERIKPNSALYDPSKPIRIIGKSDGVDLLNIEQEESNLVRDFLLLPCGHCLGCRIDKARDWSTRIMCETYTSSSAWFLTLTYDPEHMTDLSLSKADFQAFIKDLRNYCYYYFNVSDIRYFGCGEYGDFQARKHLHIIVWNLPKLDFFPYRSKKGILYYSSAILESIWAKGFVVSALVVPEVASYVARYTLKKQSMKKYDDLKIQAPFILMSTRPGIGYKYFLDNQDKILSDGGIFVGHKLASIPRYFKSKLPEDIQDKLNKDIKNYVFNRNFIKELVNDRSLCDILSSEEINLIKEQEQIKRL